MKSVALTSYPRSLNRRRGVKELRKSDRVPAIIYGSKNPSQNLEVTVQALKDLLHHSASENVLVDLSVEGDARSRRLALVQEIQHHPLSGKVLHVDFHEVAENEKVSVHVPVETFGDSIGVKNGGVLEHVLFKIRVRGFVKDLPEVINVDVTNLEIGQAVHLGELPLPAGVEAIGEKGIPVIACAAPISEAQEQAAEAAAAAAGAGEPEMLKEKKDEEGAEGAAPAKAGDKAAAGKAGEKPAAAAAAAGAKKEPEKKAEKKK